VWKMTITAVTPLSRVRIVYNVIIVIRFGQNRKSGDRRFIILYAVSGMYRCEAYITRHLECIRSSGNDYIGRSSKNVRIANKSDRIHYFFPSFRNVQSTADLNAITIYCEQIWYCFHLWKSKDVLSCINITILPVYIKS